jgi:hypothetical protein
MENALLILAFVDALLGLALKGYDVARQLSGDMPIPTFDEIIIKAKTIKEQIEQAKQE